MIQVASLQNTKYLVRITSHRLKPVSRRRVFLDEQQSCCSSYRLRALGHCAIRKIISVAFLRYPGLGLALSEHEPWRSVVTDHDPFKRQAIAPDEVTQTRLRCVLDTSSSSSSFSAPNCDNARNCLFRSERRPRARSQSGSNSCTER